MSKSIKRDFFFFSVILSVIITLIFGIFIVIILFDSEFSYTKRIIMQKNSAISNYIEGYFQKFLILLNTLSEIDEIKYPKDDISKKKVQYLYKKVQEEDKNINYIYSGYSDGSLIINGYTPPIGFDPRIRPWYVEAVINAPNTSKGIPYKEIKTGEWLISISKALYHNKKISGVISIDTNLDQINQLINKKDEKFKSLYSYIIKDGIIIFHPKKSLLFKKFNDLTNKDIKFSYAFGNFEYKFKNQNKMAYYTNLPTVGWTVITAVDKREILLKIFLKILFAFSFVIITSIFMGMWISSIARKKIINPLISLKENVINITNNRKLKKTDYPNNEIGIIANEIEKITQTELYKKNIELSQLNEKLKELSIKDKLTGLYNRHKTDEELNRVYYNFQKYGKTFSILLIDIDKFKNINDTYGHLVGDKVLEKLANIFKNTLRKTDIPSRWGGEEFLIILPETDLQGAYNIAEKLRKKVENTEFPENIKLTISIGVGNINEYNTIKELLNETDNKLYTAKKQGRNKTIK
ncbi:diguanylate cyclase [Thermosipho sp. 1063]|uniref:sensor domain-containing diguanylate cyclase n=1 Tax=unclassified Thermosipho (in: thermotogales) TaxID=2676525 RepID=UPI0009493AA1|nr:MULTISPECIES: sensor domain-containing diguanylate cyclase [unclassified Thermosipho (in: thermotogales)]ANQ53781.1 diguanylate cyclase [Thermosipho sp. 1070]APT72227.1 diguanylate cyclase [Thermosipho sp. 1063]